MCIRDRYNKRTPETNRVSFCLAIKLTLGIIVWKLTDVIACLLYTSDAADERSSVDLGGRRIIKKKNNEHDVEYGFAQ